LTGTLTNNGSINATATASDPFYSPYALAYGICIDGDEGITGSLDNTGIISATATANGETDYAYASAWGIYANGDLTGTNSLDNSGTISGSITVSTPYSSFSLYRITSNCKAPTAAKTSSHDILLLILATNIPLRSR